MAHDIRIISVELNNYRQFYGKQTVEFSSREEGFTTLIGENGEGKSNLLNAINWCFYKFEPHGKKDANYSAPILNSTYLLEVGEEKTARTSVKVLLQVGDEQYSISRVLTVLVHKIEYEKLSDGEKMMKMAMFADDKVPSGCEILPSESGFKIKKKIRGESDFHEITDDYNTVINQILPRGLSIFFLLDGEFLEKFWDNFESVENGIEQISQLHLLSDAVEHVDDMTVRHVAVNTGSEEGILNEKMDRHRNYEKSLDSDGNEAFSQKIRWVQIGETQKEEYYHTTGKPRINDLEHDIKKMERRSQEISRSIGNVNAASAKVLTDSLETNEKLLDTAKKDKKRTEETHRDNLIGDSAYVFTKNALEKTVEIVQGFQKQGELPNETRKTFTNDLLEREYCICHTDLKSNKVGAEEKNTARAEVEKARDIIAGDVGLDISVKMRYSFKDKVLDDYTGFLEKTFGDPAEKFRTAEKAEAELQATVKGIRTQLGSAGDAKITALIDEQDHILEEIKTAEEKIHEIGVQLKANADDTDICKQKLIRLSAKDSRAKKANHDMQIWDKAKSQFEKILEELKEEVRIQVQDKTWEIYREIMYGVEKFKKFEIRADYSVILLNQQNQNHIVDMAAGQSLFLAISFVTALREITGYKFPLVIDTPLGKIAGTSKYNLAKILPSHLKGEQLTFLATDTEWIAEIPDIGGGKDRGTKSFGEIIAEQIPIKHFRIKQDKHGNSTIKPAKLEGGKLVVA